MLNRKDLLSGTRPEVGRRILVTEKENFQGYEIMDHKGMVWGISMRSKDAVQDFFMGFKQFVGGELTSYTELSDESRQKALDRLLESARRIGANAVINFRFEISSSTFSGNSEVVAYGNAVVIRPIKNFVPIGGLGNILAEFVDVYSAGNLTSIYDQKTYEESPEGQILENSGYKFVVCPHCGTKYKVDVDKDGKPHIAGLTDVDDIEPGMQIFCIKCGTKFTVPEK